MALDCQVPLDELGTDDINGRQYAETQVRKSVQWYKDLTWLFQTQANNDRWIDWESGNVQVSILAEPYKYSVVGPDDWDYPCQAIGSNLDQKRLYMAGVVLIMQSLDSWSRA